MVIASKLGFDYPESPAGGLTAAEIELECEKSLRRLGTDHLDLYYSHKDDRATPLEETMAAFDRLVSAGKVRAIGASNLAVWRIAEANQAQPRAGMGPLRRHRAALHLPAARAMAPISARRFS